MAVYPYVIKVKGEALGWSLEAPAITDSPMVFRSKADAERSARKLAQQIAAVGRYVEVHVVTEDGEVAGRSVYAPAVAGQAATDEEADAKEG